MILFKEIRREKLDQTNSEVEKIVAIRFGKSIGGF